MTLRRKSRQPRATMTRVSVLALCITALLILGACRQESAKDSTGEDGIRREFERGPVKVILNADRKEISVADKLNFRIEILADEAYDARIPPFGDKLEQFGILDYRTSQPELQEGGKIKICRSYVLEPFLSGEYTIPAMTIEFQKKGASEDQKHAIETEEIKIKVRSLLPKDVGELKIHEIIPPADLPRPVKAWAWTAAAVAVISIITLTGLLVWRSRRKSDFQAAPTIPPHEIAFAELQKLVEARLIENAQVKLFYQRISDILRRYIESRFGLHAPEQTTEEFLECLQSSDALDRQYRPLLDDFLSHCDLVKFAEHQPEREEIQKTFDSCKAFILGTRLETGGST